jgi:hypothetical protein
MPEYYRSWVSRPCVICGSKTDHRVRLWINGHNPRLPLCGKCFTDRPWRKLLKERK